MPNEANQAHQKVSGFQLLMLVLSVYVLGALFLEAVVKLSPEVSSLLRTVDTCICFLFLGDFFYRLYHAENRAAFMKWGWIDLISSIPTLDMFRWGRAVRVVRILRLLRGVRATKLILTVLLENKGRGTLSLVAMVSGVLIIFSSIAMLHTEPGAGGNIQNAGDALWWAVSTITTVGYGDKFPVTTEGRIVAAILMTAGVGLFGTFTACVAAFFLKAGNADKAPETDLISEIRLVRQQLEKLEAKLTKEAVALPAQFGPVSQ